MGTVLTLIPVLFPKMKRISGLSLVIMFVLMTLFGTNVTYGTHQTQPQERHIRAPFNGMRGKRTKDDYQINRWLLKRAPFNGMRGKRDFENGLYEDYHDQEELNLLSELVKRRGRAPGAGFVGMRG